MPMKKTLMIRAGTLGKIRITYYVNPTRHEHFKELNALEKLMRQFDSRKCNRRLQKSA